MRHPDKLLTLTRINVLQWKYTYFLKQGYYSVKQISITDSIVHELINHFDYLSRVPEKVVYIDECSGPLFFVFFLVF